MGVVGDVMIAVREGVGGGETAVHGTVVAGNVVIQQTAVQAQILLAGVQAVIDYLAFASLDGDTRRQVIDCLLDISVCVDYCAYTAQVITIMADAGGS